MRTLVENGLAADVALRALTSGAATILGAGDHIGRIEPGLDADIAVWTKNPLTTKDAQLSELFVDGWRHEFEQEKGAVISELARNEDSPWDLEQKAILPLLFPKDSPYSPPVRRRGRKRR